MILDDLLALLANMTLLPVLIVTLRACDARKG